MEKKEALDITHSKGNMASYGFAKFLNEFLDMAFTAFGFFFYESEIGLNVWLVGLGYVIFALWNAVNDPLVGYLTNRPFRFTKKWGRRFPWIMFGAFFWVISYILVFMPPDVDPNSGALIIFGWLIFSTCLYDTFNSFFFVNFSSLFPDKFRSVKERRTATGIQTPIGIFGVALGAILPPLFITFGNLTSYIVQAGVMIIVGVVVLFLAIPGCREDQILIDRYLEKHEKTEERQSFFGALKMSMAQKTFVVFILTYTFYRTLVISIQSSVPYVVRFVLGMEASAAILLSAGFLIGALFSTPLWIKLAHKTNNNKKVMLIAALCLSLFTVPLMLLSNYFLLFIAMIIWGVGLGGFWAMISPVLADVIDESVVNTGKREEGIYNGFQQFFGRLAIIFQAMSFAIVHSLTGFQEGSDTQPPLAIIGIQIHFGLVPMLFMLAGALIFWKFYKLTPEKVAENQAKVEEMGL
ncbi:MAG: MFS transporter [Candidatus Lokiarchaeota archaeon]|nr:MFS transporter [Candidatus Lokiarchaeota archaeon]